MGLNFIHTLPLKKNFKSLEHKLNALFLQIYKFILDLMYNKKLITH